MLVACPLVCSWHRTRLGSHWPRAQLYSRFFLLYEPHMKVHSLLRPRVPVAAHWQQSGRGANNVPNDSLQIPQVHSPTQKRTTQTEEAVKKTSRRKSSENSRTQKTRTVRGSCKKQPNSNVSSLKVTNHQSETPCQPVTKMDKSNVSSGLNIGTWNVRTLQTDGNWEILLEEASKFRIDILGLCETNLIGKETLLSKGEYTILMSNRADGMCTEGVGIMISQHMTHCLESYDTVSSRLVTAKFNMKEGTLNINQVYAPTSSYSE